LVDFWVVFAVFEGFAEVAGESIRIFFHIVEEVVFLRQYFIT
tara:strand:+ start:257 stop:382 length:126 start_codon:yes stop_codon:yes gene_type:complete